ncbi:MAG: PQQ-binding-like beta-propeller repeat protein [Candidatus Pacebacteria bacterium]|nr:PQQ-binding-like beta-propeller repeat protein [Candidatus Paceibacterota bacterium]
MKIRICLITAVLFVAFSNQAAAQSSSWWEQNWAMSGANPQRISWTAEEVRGTLSPVWYRPINPYVNGKIQVIAANDLVYLSTARGLYALNASNGDIAWVYPTELPLGQSPTVVEGRLYVGGYDKKVHAIEAKPSLSSLPVDSETGYRINNKIIWIFDQAEAGFETNPLVVNNIVYVGNRDGKMYALNSTTGSLLWSHQTGGPILFSAAYADNVIYFAANDAHAYALNATTGARVWKSPKLPGAGFHSFWPVIYQNYVIFGGSHNYLIDFADLTLQYSDLRSKFDGTELREVFTANNIPNGQLVSYPQGNGTQPGDWVSGTQTVDVQRIVDHYEQPTAQEADSDPAGLERNDHKPWKRTYFVINRANGNEVTFDADSDGLPDYAPFLWGGWSHGGNRYPPVIGSDGVLYQFNNYISDPWIGRGHVVGWKFGTKYISNLKSGMPNDEFHTFSAGGNLIYFQHWESEAGAIDISTTSGERVWNYYTYNLYSLAPGYSSSETHRSQNRIYGEPKNPPIPYKGKVFYHVYNGLLAFGPNGNAHNPLPNARPVNVRQNQPPIAVFRLKEKLETEVQKMIEAGHLRPGYHSGGIPDPSMGPRNLIHYFHNPAETIETLIRTLPHLSPSLQQQARSYIQQEYEDYPPYQIAQIGWATGSKREAFETLPEIQLGMNSYGSKTSSYYYEPAINVSDWSWDFPQYNFYALWKYAEEFGGASTVFNQIKNKLESPPSNNLLTDYPYMHNAYIAGYIGYCKLEELVNTGSNNQGIPQSCSRQSTLNSLLQARIGNFSKDNEFGGGGPQDSVYLLVMNTARNFLYLVPELGDYLNQHALSKVQEAVDEYNYVTPGWFVSKFDDGNNESGLQHLLDVPAVFQAKALILKESYEELVKYLDVPGFEKGDLFYIQNLVATIEANSSGPVVTPTPALCLANVNNDGSVGLADFLQVIGAWGKTGSGLAEDINNDRKVNGIDLGEVIREWGKNCQ